mmetsp:Transcript_23640/g.29788  ORF Transcript_23640/g.29788 Transcript_23640/m.29788 type:complete len:118 (-) Transcript_23640:279-632(-)
MTRQRSLSITPTYSTDRALLLSHNPTAIAPTVDEAKKALSTLVICSDAAFQRRVKLDTVEEWTEFLQPCSDESSNGINLETALKKCYKLAYSMPASPVVQSRNTSINAQETPEPLSV